MIEINKEKTLTLIVCLWATLQDAHATGMKGDIYKKAITTLNENWGENYLLKDFDSIKNLTIDQLVNLFQ